MKKNNDYRINEYNVHYCYAGIDQYTVYKNEKEIGTCWSIECVARMCETDAETVKTAMWEQRYI